MYLNSVVVQDKSFQDVVDLFAMSWKPLLEGAFMYTIPLAIFSFIIGLVLALIVALMRLSNVKILRGIARVYLSIIRGTPLLVQLFIIFYGLPNLGVTLSPFISAIFAFSLNVGAYASEIIRSAIVAVPKGQWEAATVIGMSYYQTMRKIILPQATRLAVPPLANTFISLVKDTSLASLILVTEMFRKAQEIAATTYEFLLIYSFAAFFYWIFSTILSFGQDYLENRLSKHLTRE
ncbi:MAG: amino acid ABC transporter permease [Bacillaceae bacterium]